MTDEEKKAKEKYELLHGPKFKKKARKIIPKPVQDATEGVNKGIIDPLLEKCLSKNMKLETLDF